MILGVDLSANQCEVTQHEAFQMEYDNQLDCWYFSTKDGKYWSLGAASTVQASSYDINARASFRLIWNVDDGTCSLFAIDQPTQKDSQMKNLCARKSGQLYTSGNDYIRFHVKFLNRTCISLRGSNSSGFVGTKGQGILF